MRYRILPILVLILGSGCTVDPWTMEQQDEFLEGCESEGGKSGYCKCFMENAMNAHPRYEDTKDISFEEAVELSKNCE